MAAQKLKGSTVEITQLAEDFCLYNNSDLTGENSGSNNWNLKCSLMGDGCIQEVISETLLVEILRPEKLKVFTPST